MVDMLSRQQADREKELRAEIEKEELNRKYQAVERNDLGRLGQQKKGELDDVAM